MEEAFDRIDGTLKRTGFEIDGVCGSLVIGLKKISSVFNESGEEQSLGVELSVRVVSDPSSFEVDPDLLVIFDRNVMPLLIADLRMLYFTVGFSLSLEDALVDAPSLQDIKNIYKEMDGS